MALYTQVIGKTMTNGYAGSYSRQPDSVIDTHPLVGENVAFGLGVVLDLSADAEGAVSLPKADSEATTFAGVAVREVKSAVNYLTQEPGQYTAGDAVPVIKRGCVNVHCQYGTPSYDTQVFLRVAANASIPNAVVGGFEAQADGANSIALTNCKWKGTADANGIAEMRIMTIINA